MSIQIDRRHFLSTVPFLAGRLAIAAPGGMYVALNASMLGGKAPWPEMVNVAGVRLRIDGAYGRRNFTTRLLAHCR